MALILPSSSVILSSLNFPPNSNPNYNLLNSQHSYNLLSNCKSIKTLKQIHAQFIKTGLCNTQFALSKLIDFCAINPSGDLDYAVSIFETIDEPNTLIWNTVIRGHSLKSCSPSVLGWYVRMISSGGEPNWYTFPFVLKAIAKSGFVEEGRQIHGHVLKFGVELDVYVNSSLINMYAQKGELRSARKVFDESPHRDPVSFTALITGYVSRGHFVDAGVLFDEIPVKDVVSWNAMIAGYAKSGQFNNCFEFFQKMLSSGVTPDESTLLSVLSACAQSGSLELGKWVGSWIKDNQLGTKLRLANALIDMYAKCGDLETARSMFTGLHQKDRVSWNVMIGGYTHGSRYVEALTLFREMLQLGIEPNDVTFLSVVSACAHIGALDYGKWVHAYIDKYFKHLNNVVALRTSLIDMYAKCGDIDAAKQLFNSTDPKNLSCWNALLMGLAMHGGATDALDFFSKMVLDGINPDDITFVGILSTCTHAGLVELGRRYFNSMIHDYKISPKLRHYGCMVDLLSRSGLFDEAEELIRSMPMKPDGAIWGALLASCKLHNKIELAERIANHLFQIEPNNPGPYIVLSNIYAKANRWDDVGRIRTQLNDLGMKKIPGCTSIEVGNIVHEFLVSDKLHPQSEEIYKMLDEVDRLLAKHGHVPDTSEVLHDTEEELKEGALSHHSERLAIAYGLISTKPGTVIRIVKNLRVCGNCHSATKLISKIFKREIIARDRNRFHHFKDGSCSCMDRW